MIKKIAHVLGVLGAYAGAVALIALGAAGKGGAPPGQLITLGITLAIASTIAVIDGARAVPWKIGMWTAGAKFEGLTDAALLVIVLVLGAGIGISFAFK
jgi:hypothetical protein